MQFGEKVRVLCVQRSMTQQDIADCMGISVSCNTKVENEKLHVGEYTSEKITRRLAGEFNANEDKLIVSANKVPTVIQDQIRRRSRLFQTIVVLDDDKRLDQLTYELLSKSPAPRP